MQAYAVQSTSPGDLALLDLPRPVPGEHDLLVQVAAIGVGVHDEYFLPPALSYPYVVGIEASGTVVQVGAAVTSYGVGDRVAFVSAMQAQGGTWAEYAVVADSALIVPVPDRLSFEAAAALPVAGNTALKALLCLDPRPGNTVFVAGGAGAIGTLTVQLAAARGLRVLASASPRNHDYLRSLGVVGAVDYHDPAWHEQVLALAPGGVDTAIAVHPGTVVDCEPVVRDGGTIVAVSGDQHVAGRGIEVAQIPYAADVSEALAVLLADVSAGVVRQQVEVHPFADALRALEQVKTRHTRGKLVVRVLSAP